MPPNTRETRTGGAIDDDTDDTEILAGRQLHVWH